MQEHEDLPWISADTSNPPQGHICRPPKEGPNLVLPIEQSPTHTCMLPLPGCVLGVLCWQGKSPHNVQSKPNEQRCVPICSWPCRWAKERSSFLLLTQWRLCRRKEPNTHIPPCLRAQRRTCVPPTGKSQHYSLGEAQELWDRPGWGKGDGWGLGWDTIMNGGEV